MAAIKGLERFQEHFSGFEDQYVLIGGVACHLWFQESALDFRATRDFDVVLLTEALTPEFVQRVWDFVGAGRYQMKERSDREHRYYRFSRPEEPDFPFMLELFIRLPDGLDIEPGQTLIPLPMDEDVSSLSAILLDAEYYRLIQEHQRIINDLPLVEIQALIPLKAKAWLDLTARRESGEAVDADDITKHRSDVFRLALLLTEEMQWTLSNAIAEDLQRLLDAFPSDSPEWTAIRNSVKAVAGFAPSAGVLREAIANAFGLSTD